MLSNNYLQERLHNLWTTMEEKENKKINLSDKNREKLILLKNKHKGERCFIIGSSPSLKQLDLSLLNNEITFTVNRGYKLSENGFYNFNYHVLQDTDLYNQERIKEEIPYNKYENIFLYAGIKPPIEYNNIIFFEYMKMINYKNITFQDDLTQILPEGYTVIFTALEFAYWLGFNEIYIIGVDLDYINTKGYIYAETPQELLRQKNSIMNAKRMINSIAVAAKFLNKSDISVYNASPCGCLDCIPRVNFEDIFNA